ncbi:lipid asymmetry maintenance protein MlaB [Vibrio sp. 99-70-13A1]|uniref:STAS domain-containing protein n=1 Tax=Vibrio sp. 99-70-13A1 TaxID=2607601 RepID=UPI001493CD6E|nr:lipid asymmetry maintenance protein MlaB [Vibrio sp. 99-70-13A1]NOH97112.1 STAS domain-containing protein [Vibrio sp. 99-70-13A1]
MSHPQWKSASLNEFQLSGDLDRESVPSLWLTLERWKTTESEVQVDLNQVNRIDSAGMVMLIHLIEHAKNQNCHIMLSFVPEQLRTLFQLSNIQPLMAKHLKD